MNIAVFFGGKSCEHDISIVTGVQVLNELNNKHNTIPIYINGSGDWLSSKDFFNINTFKDKKKVNGSLVHFRPNDRKLYTKKDKSIATIDVCIICNHGLMGEDGTLQGLLQLYNIPYTGSNVRASAIAMDKINTKDILKSHNINLLDYIGITWYEYNDNTDECIQKIEQLGFPLIVKPSNLGSSIGISIANDSNQLLNALEIGFELDNRVVVEKALENFIECNCAVIGSTTTEKIASEVEQPTGWKEFLSFKDKYEMGAKSMGTNKNMPANVPLEMRTQIQQMALQIFEILGCSGVARIDFMIKDDAIYFNEINAIPGSLSNYLFSYDKFDFGTLLQKLIEIAIKEYELQNSLNYSYDSTVLQNINNIKK